MCLYPLSLKGIKGHVPCGKCIECLIQRSTEWAYRVMLEARQYKDNCMITLTYNDDFLPPGGSLSVRDYQLFLKKLRNHIGKFRYFLCGEYGDEGHRPHYHVIIFGWKPSDMWFFCYDKKGTPLYRSPFIENDIWIDYKHIKGEKEPRKMSIGFSSVGELNFDTAKYCAVYLQKKGWNDNRVKPFVRMSTRPGIGYDSIDSDMLLSDKIYYNARYIKIPRYFLDCLEKQGFNVESVKAKRKRLMERQSDDWQGYWDGILVKRKKFLKIFDKSLDEYTFRLL